MHACAAPYFRSERRWQARGLLAAIVALNLAAVYMLVQINSWNRLFYDALQQRDAAVFWAQLAHFAWLALAYVVIAVYRFYLTQRLQIDWRRWLTEHQLAGRASFPASWSGWRCCTAWPAAPSASGWAGP